MVSKALGISNNYKGALFKILNNQIFDYCKDTEVELSMTGEVHLEYIKNGDPDDFQFLDRVKINENNIDFKTLSQINSIDTSFQKIEEYNFNIEFIIGKNIDEFNIYSLFIKINENKKNVQQIKKNEKMKKDIKLLHSNIDQIHHNMTRKELEDLFGSKFGFENSKDKNNRKLPLNNDEEFYYEMHFKYPDSKQFRMYFGFVATIQQCSINCKGTCNHSRICSSVDKKTKVLIYHAGEHL